jgi:hypothetical protein
MGLRNARRVAFLLLLALSMTACATRGETSAEDLQASAVDACWSVSKTGDLSGCQERLLVAQRGCAKLPTAVSAACSDQLKELGRATIEGYHLARHECDQLTSDGARSMCLGNAPRTPTAVAGSSAQPATPQSPTPRPTATATATATAGISDTAAVVVVPPSALVPPASGIAQPAATIQHALPAPASSDDHAAEPQIDEKGKSKVHDTPKKGKKGE